MSTPRLSSRIDEERTRSHAVSLKVLFTDVKGYYGHGLFSTCPPPETDAATTALHLVL
jgi:hypothetical protein